MEAHTVRPLCLLKLLHFRADFGVCLTSKQGLGGREAPMKATKPWNNRRFIGTFDVENTTKGDSGYYRCIVHSDKGVGVSNYGELTIKRKCVSYSRLQRLERGRVALASPSCPGGKLTQKEPDTTEARARKKNLLSESKTAVFSPVMMNTRSVQSPSLTERHSTKRTHRREQQGPQ